ncbi:hypothetical protein M9Y10_020630 [Tritrichomonas musculus]|uniref:Ankyrin repeat protein n=1 Tax=Tritrichomonas musculus TaxID=1915356 RepID=A0ABR2HE60_9EUKA
MIIIYKTALYLAIEKGNIEIVKLLLANGKLNIDVLYKSENQNKKEIIQLSPLLFAIDHNQIEIIQLFLSNEFINISGKIGINDRSKKTISGNGIEIFEQTALYMSIEKQNINAIKLLLARPDIDINEKSFHLSGNNQMEEKTALHLAVEIGNPEIIKLLLDKKDIDINIEDSHGKKPIDYSENHEIKQLLSK